MVNKTDIIIIGAGPAGIQLGYYLSKQNINYLILERNKSPGSFFEIYPRHRTLISINKVYTGFDDPELNLRWDWNSLLCDDDKFRISNYSKDYFPDAKYLLHYLKDYVIK